MRHQILSLFVNILTGDDKSYLFNREKLAQPIQMKLYQKEKTFSEIFFAFLKSILNFESCQKGMTLIVDVFPEIPVPKNMVR